MERSENCLLSGIEVWCSGVILLLQALVHGRYQFGLSVLYKSYNDPIQGNSTNWTSLTMAMSTSMQDLTQTSRLLAPRPTKLQPRSIRNLNNLPPQKPTLTSKQRLRDRLPSRPKPSQHNLHPLNLSIHPTLPHPSQHITRQLKRTIIMFPPRFPEPNIPTAHRDHGRAIGSRDGDMGVVSRSVDVEVVRLGLLLCLRGDQTSV